MELQQDAVGVLHVHGAAQRMHEVEQRLHEEIASVLGDRTPTMSDLPALPYTRMVIEEAMRLYPPVWATNRETYADDEIGGFHISARSSVVVSPYVTHRHPSFWNDPEKFDPERFSPSRAPTDPSTLTSRSAADRAAVSDDSSP